MPLGHLHGPSPSDEQRQLHPARTYLRLMRYVAPYWHWLALTIVLSVLTALTGILPQQVIGVAVNELAGRGGEIRSESAASGGVPAAPSRPPARRERRGIPIAPALHDAVDLVTTEWFPGGNAVLGTYATYGAAFLLIFLLSNGVSVLQGLCMSFLGQSIIYDLRNRTYRHLQRLSLTYFDNNQTGDVMSRVVNDVNSLEQVIVAPVIDLLTDIGRFAFLLYFCLRWDWLLTVLALGVTPLLVGTTWVFGRLLRRDFRLMRRKMGELNARLQDSISGIRVIKAFGVEGIEAERFGGLNREVYRVQLRLARMFTVFRPVIGLLNHVGTVLVLCIGGVKVARGELEVGVFVVFFEYLRMMYGPVNGITRFYNHIQRALASAERVFELLDTAPEVDDAPDATPLTDVRGAVSLRGVSFSYSDERPALSDVTLDVAPGEMVALVGPSGAGKSTLANLVLRFYDPTAGAVLIDGHDVRGVTQESLRSHLGVVLQDPFLFNDTVRHNITYAKPDAGPDEAERAARAAGAHEFIERLPNGYDTVIGERGVKLSGGQRQRLSIARAVVADPRILILDEATSSVDTETEQMIQDAVYRMARNRTTIVIAHRLSTVQHADRIVVLDAGRVVESGTHDDLVARPDGLYARLWRTGGIVADSSTLRKQRASRSAYGGRDGTVDAGPESGRANSVGLDDWDPLGRSGQTS
jgi:subfamily B ATP-binding cassette protein MsbA